jgi:hypothetical protein
MGILKAEFHQPTAEEIQVLVQRAYDAGCFRGREETRRALQGLKGSANGGNLAADQVSIWMATRNTITSCSLTNDIKRLRHDLAELEEMVRLGAGLPGDQQTIEMIKVLLGLNHKITPPVPLILNEIERDIQTRH